METFYCFDCLVLQVWYAWCCALGWAWFVYSSLGNSRWLSVRWSCLTRKSSLPFFFGFLRRASFQTIMCKPNPPLLIIHTPKDVFRAWLAQSVCAQSWSTNLSHLLWGSCLSQWWPEDSEHSDHPTCWDNHWMSQDDVNRSRQPAMIEFLRFSKLSLCD